MGQAKNRGTFEERLNSAPPRLPKSELLPPSYISCSQCSQRLINLVAVPQMVVSGLSAVYVASCEDCDFFSFHLVQNCKSGIGFLNFSEILLCEASRLEN